VKVDEFGAVCWPNGLDLAPDAMHEELTGAPPLVPATAGEARRPCRRETRAGPLDNSRYVNGGKTRARGGAL
jgi:hypothetical protein